MIRACRRHTCGRLHRDDKHTDRSDDHSGCSVNPQQNTGRLHKMHDTHSRNEPDSTTEQPASPPTLTCAAGVTVVTRSTLIT